MTTIQIFTTIAMVVLGTILTRSISFIVFPANRETPPFIAYLGKVLPAAVMGMLVIYCYKSIDFASGAHGIPEILSGLVVAGLQFWKKNMLISICVGTVLYMVLIRVI